MLAMMICVLSFSATAMAESIPYETYTYWQYDDLKKAVPMKSCFDYVETIYGSSLGIEAFNNPNGLYVKNGKIYISDTENNRIVESNSDGTLSRVITECYSETEAISLKAPREVFVTDAGDIFICDTGNARVIVSDENLQIKKIIEEPESDIIPAGFEFKPISVLVDSRGYIYVLSDGCYYGALLFDKNYEFDCFYGANDAEGSVLDAFNKVKDLIFGSNEKKSASVRTLPYQFADFAINNDFIYTVTRNTKYQSNTSTGQIRKLNSGGSNILRSIKNGELVTSNRYKFQDEGYYTGEINSAITIKDLPTDFISMSVDSDGYIYALDYSTGKIFVYDSNCNYMTIFGGGIGFGVQDGTFVTPISISVEGDKIYVLDQMNLSVTVFEKNDFGEMYFGAQKLTLNGEHSEAREAWRNILKEDANIQLAYTGIAQAYYAEEDYESACEYAQLGNNQDLYAKALQETRNGQMSKLFKNFVPVLAILIVVIYILYRKVFKGKICLKINKKVKIALGSLLHPFINFERIKYYNEGSTIIATVILAIYFVSSVLRQTCTAFSFHVFEAEEYSVMMTLASSLGIVILWCVVNWLICTLMSGKGTFKQIYIATSYCMIPLIVKELLYVVLSYVLVPSQQMVLTLVESICLIYALFMICVSFMKIHEYNFFQFLKSTVVCILGMILLVFIIFLLLTLAQQAYSFLSVIFNEIFNRR